ncbi:MAG: hypothetical protein GY757_11205 [bacterium]|nr:hypothetical protein [bacterium]
MRTYRRVPFDMSAAPRPFHQTILLNLAFAIKEFVEGKKCRVFINLSANL